MSAAVNEGIRRESLGDNDHDPQFDPVITLPEVVIPTLEEDETILHSVRAKLFRLDTVEKEWKERGTGEAKLLYHKERNTVRVLMRRDKTLKVCANHYVTADMILKPNCGSDRAWLWSTHADTADGIPKSEILAIKFLNADAARRWKDKFEEAKELVIKTHSDTKEERKDSLSSSSPSSSDSESEDTKNDVVNKMKEMTLAKEVCNEKTFSKEKENLMKIGKK